MYNALQVLHLLGGVTDTSGPGFSVGRMCDRQQKAGETFKDSSVTLCWQDFSFLFFFHLRNHPVSDLLIVSCAAVTGAGQNGSFRGTSSSFPHLALCCQSASCPRRELPLNLCVSSWWALVSGADLVSCSRLGLCGRKTFFMLY